MGYTTDFRGSLGFSRSLTVEEKQTLEDFNEERHEGYNFRGGFPSFYCQWTPTEDGTALEWDGGEKFYGYVEWLQHLIKEFFEPWGIKLNGEIDWYGEENTDMGRIRVTDNDVKVFTGRVTFEEEA